MPRSSAELPQRPDATRTPDREARGFSFALEPVTGTDGITRLSLRALHHPKFGAICADWLTPDLARRIAAGRRQPIARAIGLHKPRTPEEGPLRVLDATAGLGRDAFTLAMLGARLSLLERNPSTCALLRDARLRALAAAGAQAAAERTEILEGEAVQVLAEPANRGRWDVIYLDPMYPDDGKSALPSKEMQLLRELTGGDADADALLAPAQHCALRRVVVKRPAKAPPLAGIAPSLCFDGTQLRFDVYLCPAP